MRIALNKLSAYLLLIGAATFATALQQQQEQQQQQQQQQSQPNSVKQISGSDQHQASAEPYSFGYTAESIGGFATHQESGDSSGRVTGFYTIQGEDGRERRVDYVADENGYRASVKTNEVGTRSESSADAQYQVQLPSAKQLEAAKIAYEQYKYLEDVHEAERDRSVSRLRQLDQQQSEFTRQQQQQQPAQSQQQVNVPASNQKFAQQANENQAINTFAGGANSGLFANGNQNQQQQVSATAPTSNGNNNNNNNQQLDANSDLDWRQANYGGGQSSGGRAQVVSLINGKPTGQLSRQTSGNSQLFSGSAGSLSTPNYAQFAASTSDNNRVQLTDQLQQQPFSQQRNQLVAGNGWQASKGPTNRPVTLLDRQMEQQFMIQALTDQDYPRQDAQQAKQLQLGGANQPASASSFGGSSTFSPPASTIGSRQPISSGQQSSFASQERPQQVLNQLQAAANYQQVSGIGQNSAEPLAQIGQQQSNIINELTDQADYAALNNEEEKQPAIAVVQPQPQTQPVSLVEVPQQLVQPQQQQPIEQQPQQPQVEQQQQPQQELVSKVSSSGSGTGSKSIPAGLVAINLSEGSDQVNGEEDGQTDERPQVTLTDTRQRQPTEVANKFQEQVDVNQQRAKGEQVNEVSTEPSVGDVKQVKDDRQPAAVSSPTTQEPENVLPQQTSSARPNSVNQIIENFTRQPTVPVTLGQQIEQQQQQQIEQQQQPQQQEFGQGAAKGGQFVGMLMRTTTPSIPTISTSAGKQLAVETTTSRYANYNNYQPTTTVLAQVQQSTEMPTITTPIITTIPSLTSRKPSSPEAFFNPIRQQQPQQQQVGQIKGANQLVPSFSSTFIRRPAAQVKQQTIVEQQQQPIKQQALISSYPNSGQPNVPFRAQAIEKQQPVRVAQTPYVTNSEQKALPEAPRVEYSSTKENKNVNPISVQPGKGQQSFVGNQKVSGPISFGQTSSEVSGQQQQQQLAKGTKGGSRKSNSARQFWKSANNNNNNNNNNDFQQQPKQPKSVQLSTLSGAADYAASTGYGARVVSASS